MAVLGKGTQIMAPSRLVMQRHAMQHTALD
jgi:hypothetical protein